MMKTLVLFGVIYFLLFMLNAYLKDRKYAREKRREDQSRWPKVPQHWNCRCEVRPINTAFKKLFNKPFSKN